MSENLRIALITAAAAVLGGMVAAGAGVLTTVVTQNNENERVERRLEQEAQGAARFLISRFRVARDSARIMVADNRYRPFRPKYFTSLSPRDLMLIDSRLTPDEFIDVDSALRQMEDFFNISNEEAWRRFDSLDREIVQITIDKLDAGRVALLSIADLHGYFQRVNRNAREYDGPAA